MSETLWEETKGLLGRTGLDPDEGLWIPRCRLVHMLGMRFALDVVFLDAELIVLRVVQGLRPWSWAGAWRARHVLELPVGGAQRAGLVPGMGLRLGPRGAREEGMDARGTDARGTDARGTDVGAVAMDATAMEPSGGANEEAR